MAERYLAPAVAQLVENAGRRPVAWAEDRIRREGRRYYAQSKEIRLRELLHNHNISANGDNGNDEDPDTRRKLTNLASAEASRKKKQFIQDKSFQALRKVCHAQRSLAKAVALLVATNERQRKENLRIAALLTAATSGNANANENNSPNIGHDNNNNDMVHNGNENGNANTSNTSPPPQVTTNSNPSNMVLDIHPQQLNSTPPTSFDILSSPVTSCTTGSNNNHINSSSAPPPPSQFAPLHHMTGRTACGKEEQDCGDFSHHPQHVHHNHNPNHNHNHDVQCDRPNKDVGVDDEDRFGHFGTVDAERFLSMH